ncbi:MAG: phosphopantetheine-binding protein [Corynebacterium sp.]|nr:phosphopantetheine-binding protein [Corynebacterium sp.]
MGSLQEQLAHLQQDTPAESSGGEGFHTLWKSVGLDPEVDPQSTFTELGLVELDIFELSIRGEQQFGKQVELSTVESWESLADIMAFFSTD